MIDPDPRPEVIPVHYGSLIWLRSVAFPGYVLSGPQLDAEGGKTIAFTTERATSEQWRIVNPANLADTSPVRLGDVVALTGGALPRWCLALGAIPTGRAVRDTLTSDGIIPEARWKFVDPTNPESTAPLSAARTVALRSAAGPVFHLSCGWVGAPPQRRLGAAAVPQCAGWEHLQVLPPNTLQLTARVRASSPGTPGTQSTTFGGIEIAGPDNQSAVVGELVTLLLDPNFAVTEHTTRWTITGPIVGGYEDKTGTIIRTRSSRMAEIVSWHWIAAGTYTVTCDLVGMFVRDFGMQVFGTSRKVITFTVTGPQLRRARIRSGSVRMRSVGKLSVGPAGAKKDVRVGEVRFAELSLGEGLPSTGIVMRADVAPESSGHVGVYRWVQTIRSERVIVSSSGRTRTASTGGQYWLDAEVPYAPDQMGGGVLEEYRQGDAPAQAFYVEDEDTVGAKAAREVRIAESFRMYLMWRSEQPGSIWVTLARFDWNWSTRISSDDEGEYTLHAADTRYTGQTGQQTVNAASSELPEWQNVQKTIWGGFGSELEPVAGGGGGAGSQSAVTAWPGDLHGVDDSRSFRGDRTMLVLLNQGLPDLPIFTRGLPTMHPVRTAVERALQRPMGLELPALGPGWWAVWDSEGRLVQVSGLSNARVLPTSRIIGAFDLQPRAKVLGQPEPFWFCIKVAPFCFADPEYWHRFAQRSTQWNEGPTPTDITMNAYRAQVRGIVPGASVLVRAEDRCSVWLRFPLGTTPTWDQIQAIAGLPQTYYINRVSPRDPALPPVPDPREPPVQTS